MLFLERGFAGASVNELVRIAGGSLATLYAEFGTKEKLFEAVMTRRASAAFAGAQQAMQGSGKVADELRALATTSKLGPCLPTGWRSTGSRCRRDRASQDCASPCSTRE